MRKRSIALLLTMVLLLAFAGTGSAEEAEPAPDRALLDAMLHGDRHWVIETLVEDSRINNPMAILQGTAPRKSMARDALDTYRGIDVEGQTGQALYRNLVRIMEKIYNGDEYLAGLVDSAGNLLGWIAEFFTGSSELRQTIDTLTASTEELRYESLLKSIFITEYTASDGTTIRNREDSLILVRQMQDALTYFHTFLDVGCSQAEMILGSEKYNGFQAMYVTDYAIPYVEAVEKYLGAVEQMTNPDQGKEARQMIELTAALAAVANLSIAMPDSSYEGFSYSSFLTEYAIDPGVLQVLEGAGTVMDLADTALDSYLYLNSIQGQKEAVSGSVSRLAAAASDTDMRKSLESYAHLLSAQYNCSLLSYDTIVDYLRGHNTVSKYAWSGAKNIFQKLTHISDTSMAAASVSTALSLADMTAWVADRAVGLEETCKKTYELLYWEDLEELCVTLYHQDLAAYQGNPTDSSAAKVLDDLALLQRVRLYGEFISYGLAAGQLDSWVGEIYGGGETLESYRKIYQYSIDALLAASVIPPTDGITVQSGDTMVIDYDSRVGYYGLINRSGSIIYLPELSSRLSGGLTISGTLSINAQAQIPLGIGYVYAANDLTMGAINGTVIVEELYQSSGTLNLRLRGDAVMEVAGTLRAARCDYEADHGLPLQVHDLELSGAFTGGDLTVTGSVTGNKGTVGTMTMTSQEAETLSGTLTCGNLSLLGTDLTVSGSTTVTDALYAPDTVVHGGTNLLLQGGTVSSSTYHGDLSVQNASLSGLSMSGSLVDRGGTSYSGEVRILGSLTCQATSTLAESNSLYVQRTLNLGTQSLGQGGTLRVGGDIFAKQAVSLPNLELCGAAPQDLAGTLTVASLVSTNPKGASVTGGLEVTSLLDQRTTGAFTGEPVVLGDGAVLARDHYYGDLSVLHWHMEETGAVDGSLTVRSGGSLTGQALEVSGLFSTEGAARLSGVTLTAGQLKTAGVLTFDAPLTVLGTATCGGALENTAELWIQGDLIANGISGGGTVRVSGDLRAGNSMTVTKLILDGRFRQTVTGTIQAVDLEISNTAASGVEIDGSVTVSHQYRNNGSTVHGNPVTVTSTGEIPVEGDMVLRGDQTMSGNLNLQDCTLTIQGALTLKGGLSLVRANLIVEGGLQIAQSGKTVSVDDESTLYVGGIADFRSVTVTQDGTMTVGSDLSLYSCSFSGGGTLCLRGDLLSDRAVTQHTLRCQGLVRQHLEANNIAVQDLYLENTAADGVCLDCPVTYTGTFVPGDTALYHEAQLKKGES